MNHDETFQPDLISAYFDGEVTAAERAAVERVLAESAEAREELAAYRVISSTLRSSELDTAKIDVSREVLSTIGNEGFDTPPPNRLAETAGRAKWRFSRLLPLGFTAALALLVLIGIGWRINFHVGPMEVPVAGIAEQEADQAMPPPQVPPTPESFSSIDETEMAESGPAMVDSAMVGHARLMLENSASTAGQASDAGGPVDQQLNQRNLANVYWFIDNTAAEEILVVQAQVRDVEGAVNQIQGLFTRNSIHATTVSPTDEPLGFAEERGVPRDDRAVYVESGADRVKLVLHDLQRELGTDQNAILDVALAGVLEADSRRARFHAPDDRGGIPGLSEPPAGRMKLGATMRNEKPSESSFAPTEGAPPGEAGSSMLSRETPQGGTPRPMMAPAPANEGVPAPEEYKFEDFQTIVNISNSLISKRLKEQEQLPRQPDSDSDQMMDSFAEPPLAAETQQPSEPRMEVNGSENRNLGGNSAAQQPSESPMGRGRNAPLGVPQTQSVPERQNTDGGPRSGERRLRMLVMLQQLPAREAPKPK